MLTDALAALADDLTDAGIPADIDPARVTVPGAWVEATELHPLTLAGDFEARVNVHLVAADLGTVESLDQLQNMLATALTILEPRAAIELDTFVQTPVGKLPAFTIPTRIYV